MVSSLANELTGEVDFGLREERQRLHQLPLETLKAGMWRDFPASDYDNHAKCGFVPTGTQCHVCKKTLGRELKYPYGYQTDILEDDHLALLIAGGEQGGKSMIGAMKDYAVIMGFLGEYAQSGRAAGQAAWLIGLSYEQTAQEFDYLKTWLHYTTGITLVREDTRVDPGEIHIKVPGGAFKIKTKSSADEQAAIRMESPIVVLVCEAAITTYSTYTRLRSRVGRARSQFPGYGAIIMISTFEGSTGWYPTLHAKWRLPATQKKENVKSFSLPSYSNIFVYTKGRTSAEILAMEAELTEDEFKERVLAIPSPPRNRVFDMFDPTIHILEEDAEYNPDEDVLIGIDPGYSGQPSSYAVEVIQRRRLPCGRTHYQGIDEIFEWKLQNEQICDIAMKRPWWKSERKRAVVDVAAGSHAGAGTPAQEVWRREANLYLESQRVDLLPGIQRTKSMLNTCVDPKCGEPVLVFSPSMKGVIAEFSGLPHPHDGLSHPYRWPTDRTGQVVGRVPEDRYCDGVKAVTYLFVKVIGYTLGGSPRHARVKKRKREEYALAY